MADDTEQLIPTRDHSGGYGKLTKMDENDALLQKVAVQRTTIAKWSREDLEDRYLRITEENMVLKKHARKQEDKIKRMATKLLRLVSDKKKQTTGGKKVRDVETEEQLEDLHARVAELEKLNNNLKEKLSIAKQQLSSQTKRTTAYQHVPARISTGQPRTSPPDPRLTRGMRVTGPAPPGSARRAQSPPFPRYGHSLLEDARSENKQMQEFIEQLQEQINIYELDIDALKEQMRLKDAEHEEDILKIKQQVNQGQRVAIQENVDIIRLQREVKEKSTKLTAVQAQYENLQEKMQEVMRSNDNALEELEGTNKKLKSEQSRTLRLEHQIKSMEGTKRVIAELEESKKDLENECVILKDANEKLVNSAFDLEREREWRQRENALKVQIAQLEATLKSDVGEKGTILDRLAGEKDAHDKLSDEHKSLRVQYYQLKANHDELTEKMSFFTAESATDFQELEEALVLVKQRKEKDDQNLQFLSRVEEEHTKDLSKQILELRAEHADTINELEKTRNLLIVQYKINTDYQQEMEASGRKLEQEKAEFDARLDEMAQLLDIRAARIKKLEAQLRDVAYGTRQYRPRPDEDEAMEVDEIDETIELERGQNLFEIHVKTVSLSPEAMKLLGDPEAMLFCTWEFYDFEIQSTPVLKGPKPNFNFTSQYQVTVDDFFLHYLQKESTTFELHQSIGTDYRTLAACQLRMREIIDKNGERLHGKTNLLGVGEGGAGVTYGVAEYWVRLRVPMQQAMRLYKERSKALGYLESNLRDTGAALQALDDSAAGRHDASVNEVIVKVIRAGGLQARREGMQPSPYVVYKFYDFDDSDTDIIHSSNAPEFNDRKEFPVPLTADLDKYLKTQALQLYVFDDTDPVETAYLGAAKIPLISLSQDKKVQGIFKLIKADGAENGSVEVHLEWKYKYFPPRSVARTGTQQNMGLDETPEKLAYLPGEEKLVHQQQQHQQQQLTTSEPHESSTRRRKPPLPKPSVTQEATPLATPLQSAVQSGTDVRSPPPIVSPPLTRDEDTLSEGQHVTGESDVLSDSDSSTPRRPPAVDTRPPAPGAPATPQAADSPLVSPADSASPPDPLTYDTERQQQRSQASLRSQGSAGSGKPRPQPRHPDVDLEDEILTEVKMSDDDAKHEAPAAPEVEESLDDMIEAEMEGRPPVAKRRSSKALTQPTPSLEADINEALDEHAGNRIEDDLEDEVEEALEDDSDAELAGPGSVRSLGSAVSADSEGVEVGKRSPARPPSTSRQLVSHVTGSVRSLGSAVSADSEGVEVGKRSPARPPSTSRQLSGDAVRVTIAKVLLDAELPLLSAPQATGRKLYVEYRFLGIPMEELETPYSLPLPKATDANPSAVFNFTKTFHVDYEHNYERRQYLASMLLPDDPDQGRVKFTVVTEPPEEQEDDAECEELGVATVSVREILRNQRDILDQDVPLMAVEDGAQIGSVTLSMECLSALQAVEREMDPGASVESAQSLVLTKK